jgi:hypothetical protein
MAEDRLADRVPRCFEVEDGAFDVEEVERFFAARREVLLEGDPVPLRPLAGMGDVVQRRWRLYLAMKGEADGSRADAAAVRRAAMRSGASEGARPWEAEGVSRRTWYRRRQERAE